MADNQQGTRSVDRDHGVLTEHEQRMESDKTYRDVALTPPGTKRHWNSEDKTDADGKPVK